MIIEGKKPVRLKVILEKKDAKPKILKKFYHLAKRYFNIKMDLEKKEKERQKIKEKLVEIAQTEGVRGVEDEKFILKLFKREKVLEWEFSLLKERLDNFYPFVVKEEGIVTITFPPGSIEMMENVIKKLREIFNIPPEWINTKILSTVDEQRLYEISNQYSIEISDCKISQLTWVVSTSLKRK